MDFYLDMIKWRQISLLYLKRGGGLQHGLLLSILWYLLRRKCNKIYKVLLLYQRRRRRTSVRRTEHGHVMTARVLTTTLAADAVSTTHFSYCFHFLSHLVTGTLYIATFEHALARTGRASDRLMSCLSILIFSVFRCKNHKNRHINVY